jgi:predicted enzyme related to lactoylglutathione lyase
MNIKYVHTNLVARDWQKLAEFYIKVFNCREKPPRRDLCGDWLDSATALHNAHLQGIHLYLPGYDSSGPTLEIFQYAHQEASVPKVANKEGFTHLAFAVDDVEQCVTLIKQHGGGLIGEIVKTRIEGVGDIHFAYAHDPEGNILEIQKWD